MKNGLRNSLVGLVGGVSLALSSCVSSDYRTNAMDGLKGPCVTHDDAHYSMEEFTDDNGEAYRISKESPSWFDLGNDQVREGYWSARRNDCRDVINDRDTSAIFRSPKQYPIVEVDLREKRDDEGKVITKDGKPVLEYVVASKDSCEMERIPLTNIRVNVPPRAPGFGFGKVTHELTEYSLPTVKIGGAPHYIVSVSAPVSGVADALPFGFLDVKDTNRVINHSSRFLELEGRLFRPVLGTPVSVPSILPIPVVEEKKPVVVEETPKIPSAGSPKKVIRL